MIPLGLSVAGEGRVPAARAAFGPVAHPIVDRSDELSALLDRWDRVNAGRTQIVLVSGDRASASRDCYAPLPTG